MDDNQINSHELKIVTEEEGVTLNISYDLQIEYTYQNDNPKEFGVDGRVFFNSGSENYVFDLSELKSGSDIIETSILTTVTQTSDPSDTVTGDFEILIETGLSLFVKEGQSISAPEEGSVSEPNPVPVPGAIWLLGSGLMLLVKFKRLG